MQAAVVLGTAPRARADDGPAKAPIPTHELTFQAGHVLVEGPLSTLTLCDSVAVTVHRYRLTADQLTLQRTPSGVLVKGPGLVAFCPCETPPITVRFTEANVAPPTDLMIKNAVVRVGGVPVFYTPWLWLRSPNRIGILSPHFGWRAQDGLWMGSGVHVPLKPSSPSDAYVLDVTAGAYVRGGWDLGAQLSTPRTSTKLRWDRLQTSFLEADAHGSQQLGHTALGWTADMLRGSRARVGFVSADSAGRQTDRARLELSHSDGKILAGAGMRWEAWRASALDTRGLLGPQLRLAAGTSLDRFGQIESTTSVFAWSPEQQRSAMFTYHGADLGVNARPSVFVARASLHERFTAASTQAENMRAGMAGADARVSVPLVKSWKNSNSQWSHWIEPFALVSAATGADIQDGAVSNGYRARSAQLGLTNIIGLPNTDTAFQLEVRAGIVSSMSSQTKAMALRSRSSGKWLGLGADVFLASDSSWLSSSRMRLGDLRSGTLTLRVEGRTARSWEQQRWLTDEAWLPTFRPWLTRSGWTSIGETSIAPTEWLAVNGGIGGDMTAEKTLFDFAALAYRHRCGCLAISAVVSERLGRPGWDAWGMIDLMPQ